MIHLSTAFGCASLTMTAPRTGMLLFMRPSDRNKVISTLQHYALTDDKDELVRVPIITFTDITPRF